MSQAEVRLLVDCKNLLGEGVMWNTEEQRVYWTDVYGKRLFRCNAEGNELESFELPEKMASFAFDPNGDLLAAFASGLFRFQPGSGRCERLTEFEPEQAATRLNDGRCDRAGRFVVGGCHEGFYNPVSSVLSYAASSQSATSSKPATLLRDVALTNGIAFSVDGRRMFFSDSESLVYHCFDYEPETGELGEPQVFATVPRGEGFADGACVDASDRLWSSRYYGGCVQQYNPDGSLGIRVEVPTRCVSCVCFGGPQLDTLFITTGRKDLSDKQLASEPQAGGLFCVKPGARGLPEARFGAHLF